MAGAKKKKLRIPTPPPIMNADDDDLMNDLLAQLDSRDQTVQAESANILNEMDLTNHANEIEAEQKQDAKSRFKARQARKAAALAETYSQGDPERDARIQAETQAEEDAIAETCRGLDLEIHQINPDGHCLFSAIADQLVLLGILPAAPSNYMAVRNTAAKYIFTHPDDFLPFLPSEGGEDTSDALGAGMMTPEAFERYCASVRDTAIWGGEPEIMALSRAYDVPIHVIQSGKPLIVVHNPQGTSTSITTPTDRVVRISYHRRMYGLGEHYNSLRPKNALHVNAS